MLINRVGDDEGAVKEDEAAVEETDDAQEYQTASELFELMAKNHNFQPDADETLTTRDLVILYKNIDLGTKLMSTANEFKKKRTNQYVETIVYNEDHESDSDISENLSNEDLNNVVLINNERLDLLNNVTPIDKILCHKYGNLELRSTGFTSDYDRQFLFKDPYIKEQLKNFDMFSSSNSNSPALPTSLLDYVCCKRLEDTYNFDMENIIRYVQRTIEQLKRISNGDYLTEKAKEKWREVRNLTDNNDGETKILKTSTSIPLPVERKITGVATMWDEIIHSEVDVRYLTKILEKKIAIEVPKFLCGSFKVLSKCCEDNVIVSCKSEMDTILEEKESESRVDVVFKLERSESGHVVSNISSIMVLQKSGSNHHTDVPKLLPLPYRGRDDMNNNNEMDDNEADSNTVTVNNINQVNTNESGDYKDVTPTAENNANITEMSSDFTNNLENTAGDGPFQNRSINLLKKTELDPKVSITDNGNNSELCSSSEDNKPNYILDFSSESNYFEGDFQMLPNDETENETTYQNHISTQASTHRLKVYEEPVKGIDASYNANPADELRLTMQRLNIQSSLPEENMEDASFAVYRKRKSPVRKRLTSPYENKSLALEEKKRKKLLEIRERREKRKLAMGKHCNVTKSKFGNPSILPQSSNSVTKLSITNKSFYNSIYGQTVNFNMDTKQFKKSECRSFRKDITKDPSLDLSDEDIAIFNSQKYINRSYYLDDTVTEMMYLQMKQVNGEKDKGPESPTLVDSPTNKVLNQLISLCSITESNMEGNTNSPKFEKKFDQPHKRSETPEALLESFRTNQNPNGDVIVVPLNTPHSNDNEKKMDPTQTSAEFRKSIDKIYNLMKKNRTLEKDNTKIRALSPGNTTMSKNSPVQYTESGTSIKNQPVSSNLSSISFEKDDVSNHPKNDNKHQTKYRKTAGPVTLPKVIICTKSQTQKCESEKPKNQRKKPNSPVIKTENPLKALSQLIHEFNNVQKTRQKSANESTNSNKKDTTPGKCVVRQSSGKKSNPVSQSYEVVVEKQPRQRDKRFREREEKTKPNQTVENPKSPAETKNLNKPSKRDVINLLDDYKEARGEAIRGPSVKFSSRLNSLAQPKKSYVQANIEDCQSRYGKNMISVRLQKLNNASLSAPPVPAVEKHRLGSTVIRCRQKKVNNEVAPTGPAKPPPPQSPIEKRKLKFTPENNQPTSSTSIPTSCDQITNIKPSILKKKMVAVESYIKIHYGNSKSSAESAQILLEGLKSRVPVIPTDYKLAPILSGHTVEESAAIGSTLHNIIETMIETQQKQNLQDPKFKASKNVSNSVNIDEDETKATAAPETGGKEDLQPERDDTASDKASCNLNKNVIRSTTELEKLENALTRQLSNSTFQKRLRMKNLTLTPKQSLQQALVLQSGDVGSLIFQSPQKASNVDKKLNTLTSVTDLEKASRSFDIKIPIQTVKVNYAFPIKNINLMALDNMQSSRKKYSKTRRESAAQADIFTFRTNVIQLNQIGKIQKDIMSNLEMEKKDVNENNSSIEIYKHPCSSKRSMVLKQNYSQDCTTQKRSSNEEKDQGISPITPEPVQVENQDEVEISRTESKDKVKNTNITLESVDYTSSLDILTGLLNEIQKITTCQTMMTSNEVHPKEMFECNVQNHIDDSIDPTADYPLNKCKDIISITSLDELRQLESNNSFYSYYFSNDEDHLSNKINIISEGFDPDEKYDKYDKYVNVNISKDKLVDKFTDKPSIFIPVTVNHGTNVSNSLIGIFSQPSAHSIISINETTYTTSLTARTKIIELSPTQTVEMPKETCEDEKNVKGKRHLCKKTCDDKIKKKDLDLKRTLKMEREVVNFEPGCQEVVVISDMDDEPKFDPSMKMKRDVLVTVYSILVFTVFAALSFPKMLYDA